MHLFLPLRAIMTSSIRKKRKYGWWSTTALYRDETCLLTSRRRRFPASGIAFLLTVMIIKWRRRQRPRRGGPRRGADPVGADELCRAIAELLNGSRAYVVMESYAHYHRRAKTTVAAHVPVAQVNTQTSCSAQGRRESWPSSMFQPTDISSKAHMIDRS